MPYYFIMVKGSRFIRMSKINKQTSVWIAAIALFIVQSTALAAETQSSKSSAPNIILILVRYKY